MMQAPMMTPSTLPEPPASDVPPITAAAMASSSQPVPVSGCAELKRETRMIPERPRSRPRSCRGRT